MYINHPNSDLMKDFALKHVNARDKIGVSVKDLYSVYNKLKNGSIGNTLKFTVNLYHTTSSTLVNSLCYGDF